MIWCAESRPSPGTSASRSTTASCARMAALISRSKIASCSSIRRMPVSSYKVSDSQPEGVIAFRKFSGKKRRVAMKRRYQIEQQRAVNEFRQLATNQNPNIQMVLPMVEIVGLLQQGVGHLLREAGL